MGRRKQKSAADQLVSAPWWVSIVVAVLVYGGCKVAPAAFHFESPVLAGANILLSVLSSNAHWAALPFVILAVISALNRAHRRRLFDRQTDIDTIRELSWQDFELLVGEAYRRQGYTVEETGGGGADGGIDLRLTRDGKKFVVQCKRWRQRQVPVMAIRELFGLKSAEGADGALFVSSGTYTADARSFADENGVVLIDGQALLDLIGKPASPTAPAVVTDVTQPVAQQSACPNCGGTMTRRRARRGQNAGQDFWGCLSFPSCRGTVQIG